MVLNHLLTQTLGRGSWEREPHRTRLPTKPPPGCGWRPAWISSEEGESLSCGGFTVSFLDVANSRKWTKMKKYRIFFLFLALFCFSIEELASKKKKKWRLLCLKRVISKVVWACVLKMVRQYLIFKLKYKTKYHLPNSRLGNPWEFAVARTLRLDSAIGDIWSLQLATSMLPCWYRLYRRARHFPQGLTSGRRGGGWTRDTDLFSSSLHFWQFLILVLQREVKLSLLFVVWSPPSVLGPHEQGTHGPKVSVALFGHPRRQVLLMKRY